MVSTLSSLPYSVSGAVLTSNPASRAQNPAYAQKPHQALDSFTFTGKRKIEDISHDPDEMDIDSEDSGPESRTVNPASYKGFWQDSESKKSINAVFEDIGISIDHFVRLHPITEKVIYSKEFKPLEEEIKAGLYRASSDHALYMSAKSQIFQDFGFAINRFAHSHHMDEEQKTKSLDAVTSWIQGIHAR